MVPVLQEFLGRIAPSWARSPATFSMLTDRYASALEQGLLRLDTGVKEQHGGLNFYARERECRLQDLAAGQVRIGIACGGNPAEPDLRISIRETGPGADGVACGCGAENPARDPPPALAAR